MANIAMTQRESLIDQLERLHQQIRRRAYQLFEGRQSPWGDPFSDWVTAEHEVVWTPAVEIRQKDRQIEVVAATPGVEAKDFDIQFTPDDLLIQVDVYHEHPTEEGVVRCCEFSPGRLARTIHFTESIDPNSVKADYRNGLLRLTAAIAKVQPTKIEVKAA